MNIIAGRLPAEKSNPSIWVAASALFALMVAVDWPGHAIGDNVRQLAEISAGQISDWHSPFHSTIWSLLGGSSAAMLVLQLAVYWLGLALVAEALAKRAGVRWGLAVLALSFTPLSFLYLGRTQKDTFMVAWLVLALGLNLRFGKAAGVLPALFGMLSRANAVFAVPSLFLGTRSLFRNVAIGLAVAVAMVPVSRFINYDILHARYSHVERSLMLFDIAGIEEFSGATDIQPQLSRCYTPFWWDRLEIQCHAFSNSAGDLTATWLKAIAAHPGAYLWHRLRAFNSNIYFLVPARQDCLGTFSPDCSDGPHAVLKDAVSRNPLFWPVTWLLIGSSMLFTRLEPVARALVLSGLLYGFSYLVFGVAAGFRYFYWTELAIQLAMVWQLATSGLPQWRRIAVAVAAMWIAGLAFRYLPLLV